MSKSKDVSRRAMLAGAAAAMPAAAIAGPSIGQAATVGVRPSEGLAGAI